MFDGFGLRLYEASAEAPLAVSKQLPEGSWPYLIVLLPSELPVLPKRGSRASLRCMMKL